MSSIPQKLATLLGQIRRPGDFYATGTIDIYPARLEVERVGPIALPLVSVQAEQIIAVAERAPYGRGTETLLDTDVRRTWQVEATHHADCDLYLALASIAESGWAEYAGGGRYPDRYWDDSNTELEVGEVEDSSETVHDWRHPNGSRQPLGPLPFHPDELSLPDAFDDLEPEELDFQEATGNFFRTCTRASPSFRRDRKSDACRRTLRAVGA